jgi:RNA-directed DNA polymerase
LEGDIKGCFDNIDHKHIIQTLLNWKVPKWATEITNKMLKTEIFYNGELLVSDTGTPQGGVISPLLANVALTGLDNFCFERYGYLHTERKGVKKEINPIVRYADDFIVVCKTYDIAKQIKTEITEYLHNEIGLTLSETKTNITHITNGFNFLGFNIRKYPKPHAKMKSKSDRINSDYILLIKPQKEKVNNFLRDCKEVLSKNMTAKQESIIQILNPKITGWSMYYRHVVSKRIFAYIDFHLWRKLYFWAKRRHSNKSKNWIIRRYFGRIDNTKFVFKDRTTGKYIYSLASIPIKRFALVDSTFRVYDQDPETQEYWNKREYTNAFKQIIPVRMSRLYKRQEGKCSFCKKLMVSEQVRETLLHVHHMLPRSLGGTESYSNLRLLHGDCHRELHAKFTRKEMEILWKTEDYLLKSER